MSRSGRWLRRLGTTSVVLVLVSAVAAFQFDLGSRWFGLGTPSPVTEPALVAPPPGLDLPAAAARTPVARPARSREAAKASVRRALAGLVSDRDLGRRVAVAVSQLSDGAVVYRRGVDEFIPASTLKLLTAASVLQSLGPDHRFATTVVSGRRAERIVLVGGGDPFLERVPVTDGSTYPHRVDLGTLAGATARALRKADRTVVRLGFDTSLFTGPAASPAWEPNYVPDDVVSRVSALWTNQGREKSGEVLAKPGAEAARQFAVALGRRGITVLGTPTPARAPRGSRQLAAVWSAPLAQIVQRTLEVSDNEAAEVLFRHVALATGRPGSFAAASTAVADVLGRLGVDLGRSRIADGSGLSRENRLSPQTLLSVIAMAADDEHPELRRVVTGLPAAGFNGSLTYRFETGAKQGLGRVRAKTGTLSGVHGLAGVVTGRDGTPLGFVAIADKVKLADTLDARAVIDEIAAALAACSCATT